MNTHSNLPRRLSGRHTAVGAAILMALFGIVPVATIADQGAVTTAVSRVVEVSLADLNLSTPTGMREAQERLRAMAQRVCAESSNPRGLSSQANFVACVDNTLAAHLRQIDALKQINVTTHDSVTRAANLSLADLDLSTPEGSRAAHERLETMARRVCTELARSHELAYQPNYGACVRDTLAGALEQVNAIRAAKDTRTAQRIWPFSSLTGRGGSRRRRRGRCSPNLRRPTRCTSGRSIGSTPPLPLSMARSNVGNWTRSSIPAGQLSRRVIAWVAPRSVTHLARAIFELRAAP
jgi:UrcA family protein